MRAMDLAEALKRDSLDLKAIKQPLLRRSIADT